MKIYRKEYHQNLPITIEAAWDFFSSPANLAKITPDNMTFEVTSPEPTRKMYEGMFITYNVAPLFGIKLTWLTEITQSKSLDYFVDEQRFGPFALWHHEHHFKSIEGGVHMHDILYYSIGWGIIGKIANAAMVNKKISAIFDFRYQKTEQLFGRFPG